MVGLIRPRAIVSCEQGGRTARCRGGNAGELGPSCHGRPFVVTYLWG
jgi:hypothetical protein